jgi:MoaA/NifB/PqqE/SkfB family radical SAM enzyme
MLAMSLSQLVISVTERCNSRCLACRVWQTRPNSKPALTPTQYEKVFKSWPKSIPFLSFVGGEAFLRPNLVKIILLASQNLKPKVINLATNGLLPQKVFEDAQKILNQLPPKTTLLVNLSLDGPQKIHDHTRGGHGFFKKLLITHQKLKSLQKNHPNLEIAFHSGLTHYNQKSVKSLLALVASFKPKSFILEPGSDRTELLEQGKEIQIPASAFKKILRKNSSSLWQLNQQTNFIFRLIRLGYYPFALEAMTKNRQVIPCQAGQNALYLDNLGNLYPCELRKPFTNLAKHHLNLQKATSSPAAKEAINQIKDQQCACHTSYNYYASLTHSPWFLLKALWQLNRL